jgi:hypothetical protein
MIMPTVIERVGSSLKIVMAVILTLVVTAPIVSYAYAIPPHIMPPCSSAWTHPDMPCTKCHDLDVWMSDPPICDRSNNETS